MIGLGEGAGVAMRELRPVAPVGEVGRLGSAVSAASEGAQEGVQVLGQWAGAVKSTVQQRVQQVAGIVGLGNDHALPAGGPDPGTYTTAGSQQGHAAWHLQIQRARGNTAHAIGPLTAQVRQHPVASALVALSVGALLGRKMRTRS